MRPEGLEKCPRHKMCSARRELNLARSHALVDRLLNNPQFFQSQWRVDKK